MSFTKVPSIKFYNENGQLNDPQEDQTNQLNDQLNEEESSNSSDFLFPKNVQNVVDKLKQDDSSISDQEDLIKDDVDYCPLSIESDDEEDDYNSEDEINSDFEDEERPKRKRKKVASKRNPYQNKRKIKKQKITHDDLANSEDENGVIEYTELDGGFKLPTKLWNKLYPYQQAGIKWLWELHQNSSGGILADQPGKFSGFPVYY